MPIKKQANKLTDYFLYDRANDNVVCFNNGDIIFFGSLKEAEEDCYANEEIITYNKLPSYWQETIKKQII